MVQSNTSPKTEPPSLDTWIQAMDQAGVPKDQAAIVVIHASPNIITVNEAARRTNKPAPTIHGWVQRGLLEAKGRKRGSHPGGGEVLVDILDVEYLVDHPPRGGRPRKRR